MSSPLLKRIMSAVVAILLFIYLGYQIYNSHYSQVQTETTYYATTANTVQADGIAIRKESLIPGRASGVVDYVISNGGKVANGGKIAQIYANAQSAASQQQLQSLDNEIAKLQNLSTPGDTYAASPDSINKQINLNLVGMLGNVNSCKYSDLADSRENFLYLVNERQIITSKVTDFSARINTLKAERETLATANSQATGSIAAPIAGYFIKTVDGFESVFDYSKVLNLTPEELKTKQSTKPAVPTDAVGKISGDYDWYFAFVLPENQASKFKLGDTVTIQFPFASSETVPASVAAVNQAPKSTEAAIVLQSNYMNSSIAAIRNETAQIQIEQYKGLRVSQKAVHFESVSKTVTDQKGKATTVKRDVKGVYVMHGNEILFKQIFPLYSTDTYVICDPNPKKEDLMTDTTVILSDEVVVEGTDLFNGKVVR